MEPLSCDHIGLPASFKLFGERIQWHHCCVHTVFGFSQLNDDNCLSVLAAVSVHKYQKNLSYINLQSGHHLRWKHSGGFFGLYFLWQTLVYNFGKRQQCWKYLGKGQKRCRTIAAMKTLWRRTSFRSAFTRSSHHKRPHWHKHCIAAEKTKYLYSLYNMLRSVEGTKLNKPNSHTPSGPRFAKLLATLENVYHPTTATTSNETTRPNSAAAHSSNPELVLLSFDHVSVW